VLVLAVVVVAAVAAVLAAGGTYESVRRTALLTRAGQQRAPAWSSPCWPTAAWTDKPSCVHLSGRVVWIQRRDSDGDGDRHLLVASRLHGRIVKLTQALAISIGRLPRLGTRVDAVGWLMRGGSGHFEVNTQRLTFAGRSWSVEAG
jgi:hypothetical protein